jgi:alanine-synthesizing transaminase
LFARRTNWNLTTNAYTRAIEEHRRAGGELLDLTASNPTTVGLHYDGDKLLRALAKPQALTYDPAPKGLPAAREAIAGYYAERGIQISPDDLILTTSTSEAYSFLFRLLCEPGDAVLVPTPSYPLFDFLAELQDVRLVPYELIYDHGWQMDFPSLEVALNRSSSSHPFGQQQGEEDEAPRPVRLSKGWVPHSGRPDVGRQAGFQRASCRAVLVVHPNNPTGSFVKPAEAAELARLCAQNNLAIIADEVFLDYLLKTEVENALGAQSFASCFQADNVGAPSLSSRSRTTGWENNALTFTLSGLSKIAGLPQMKVAWIAVSGPDELKREALSRLEVISDTYLSMSAPVQWAIPAMLEERASIQRQLMARIRANLAELDRQIAGQTPCTRLEVEGGWYVILRVPVTRSDEELAIALLRQTGVLVQPGHFYDFANDGYLVVSLITPQEVFTPGVQRLLRFLMEAE